MLFEARNVDGITYKEILHKKKEGEEVRGEKERKEENWRREEEGEEEGERQTDSLRNLQSLRYKQIRKNLQRLRLCVNYDVRGY